MKLVMMLVVILSILIPNTTPQLYTEFPDPNHVPTVGVRKTENSTESVSSGLLHLVGLVPHAKRGAADEKHEKKFTVAEFKRLLQCAPTEPALNGDNGAISLMKLVPPTKAILELICAWDETKCRNWKECQSKAEDFKQGKFPTKMPQRQFDASSLLRVMNGSLYDDWPWGVDRLERNHPHERLLLRVLARLNDVKDMVFFKGVEVPYLPWNYPFPFLHVAPKEGTNHIAWPWPNSFKYALDTYPNPIDAEHAENWHKRKPKAAFFSSYSNIRRIIYDQAHVRQDLFETGMFIIPGTEIIPWDPSATDLFTWNGHDKYDKPNTTSRPGTAAVIVPFIEKKDYNPWDYKYNIVMSGLNGQSGADRLARLLCQSGAVILLQKTSFTYHFSDRLKPWVHYVPLAYSGADAIEKIDWLVKHDDVAKRIAANAQAFARSYLRLEDYYCYATTALEVLGTAMETTDVTQPFNPRKLSPHTDRAEG